MSLTNKTIANSYKDILQVDNSNNGVGTSTKTIKSGDGTSSSVQICDDQFQVVPVNDDTTATFSVMSKAGSSLLNVDSTNEIVKASGHYVNTQIERFYLSYLTARPQTADTWTALHIGGGRNIATPIEMGASTGTPSATFTISTDAFDPIMSYFHLPFNITIDSCKVWFASDEDAGDVVKFSVMAYDVDSANGSTSGDLSAGAEVCVSPATIDSAGQEQAYYRALTISTANIDSGKVIIPFVSQDDTNCDLSINMTLVYHLR